MTTIRRIQFAAGTWYPRPEPPRAEMPIVVTLGGFDGTMLIEDLCTHMAANLDWADYRSAEGDNIVPLDSVPIEMVNMEALSKRVGSLVVSVDFNQPAPAYVAEYDRPDQPEIRLVLAQIVSARAADRYMLLERRRSIIDLLAPLHGNIGV